MPAHKDVQVAIIGAGLSGLRAAKAVHDAGLSYIVLESMDCVGGKVFSMPTKDDGSSPVDLGAAWINDTSQSEMYALAREYGFDLVQQRAEGNSFYQVADGEIFPLPYELPAPLNDEQIQEIQRIQEVLTGYINSCDVETPSNNPNAANLDALTMQDFIAREFGENPLAHMYASALTEGLLGVEPAEMSALFLLDYIKSGTGLVNMGSDTKNGGQYLRNRSGNQQFAKNLAAALHPDSILLSTPVTSITQSTNNCTITTATNTIITANRIILTIPSPLYANITFQPPLPPSKHHLATSGFLGYYSKTILIFSTPWWRDLNLSGILGSATAEGIGPISFSRDTSVPEDNQWSISCFSLGDKGRAWSKLDADGRREAVLKQFRAAFSTALEEGEQVPEPIKVLEKEWAKDEWTEGGPTTVLPPGVLSGEAGREMRKPFGRVHFAGTEMATVWKGYMEGAVRSGVRAAEEVIEASKN